MTYTIVICIDYCISANSKMQYYVASVVKQVKSVIYLEMMDDFLLKSLFK